MLTEGFNCEKFSNAAKLLDCQDTQVVLIR